MADHVRKVNDILPPLDVTLSDANGVFNMTSYRPRFLLRSSSGDIIADGSTTNGQVAIIGATSGRVRMNFASSHLETPGNYMFEYELYDPSSQKITFPNARHVDMVLKPNLSS